MLRSNSKQTGESMQSVLKKKGKGCGGNDLQKRKLYMAQRRWDIWR